VEWLRENWVSILIFILFIAMRLFGHGMHGGHCGHGDGEGHKGHPGSGKKEQKGGHGIC